LRKFNAPRLKKIPYHGEQEKDFEAAITNTLSKDQDVTSSKETILIHADRHDDTTETSM